MLEIDGSHGEGGGQIVRSSLALSAVTGTPIRLTNIRAGRPKPGLKRQHVTCINAAAEICGATVEGAELNSSCLTFLPDTVRGGEYYFQIGTAGSTSLVAQTVLPALMLADERSVVELEGGTHNPWAPPYDFLARTFLPQLVKTGPNVVARLHQYGFNPAGGGKIELQIDPCKELGGFDLRTRKGKLEPRVTAVVAGIPKTVGDRECQTIRRKMAWSEKCSHVEVVDDSTGKGNAVMIELGFQNVTEIFIGIGEVGVRAEHVARKALRQAKQYIASGVPVGEYLADQIMLPLGLAAHQGQKSSFLTGPLSQHSRTHIDVLTSFLDIEIEANETNPGNFLVTLSPLADS